MKRTDSLFDSFFKRTSLFLIAKTFLSASGHGHSLKKLQFVDLLVKISVKLHKNRFLSVSVQVYQTLITLYKERTPGKFIEIKMSRMFAFLLSVRMRKCIYEAKYSQFL